MSTGMLRRLTNRRFIIIIIILNMKWIGQPLAEIWPFEIFPNVRSSVVGRSVLNTSSYTDLIYSSSLR